MTAPAVGGAGWEAWLALGVVLLASAAACGLLVALLVRRIHPRLSLYRMWLFYSVLTGLLVATVLLAGLF